MSRQRRPPIAKTVWVEVDGKRYEGSYVIEKRLITVSMMMGGSITTQLGGSRAHPGLLATMILLELVGRYERRSSPAK